MCVRGIRQLLALLIISVIMALIAAAWHENNAQAISATPGEISPEETARIPSNRIQFVDARSHEEFARGHPPGAVLLNNADWDSLIARFYDAWEPGKRIIVYGRARTDEPTAIAHRLRLESGLEVVFVLKGVWEECP